MTIRRTFLIILLAGVFSILTANSALARGILGFQLGDRSQDENDSFLKEAVEQIKIAIKEAQQGNGEKSVKHGKTGFAAMKEINSEGWAAQVERSLTSIRRAIAAAKKGNLEKASSEYQNALTRLGSPKRGDLNWTHESFLGIGDRR